MFGFRKFQEGLPFRPTLGIVCLVVFQLLGSSAQAQTGSLSLSSGSADAGAGVALNLILTSGNTAPASVQWTLTYIPGSIAAISASAGVAAISAGKSITCVSRSGSYSCIIAGLNTTAIPDGTVAVVNVTSLAIGGGIAPIEVANTLGASPSGTAVTFNGYAGSVGVNPPAVLTAVTCHPTVLSTANTSICIVALSQTAPGGGVAISLSSNNALLSVPGSVTVSAGSLEANFVATAGSIATDQTAAVMATYNGISKITSLSLSAPITVSSLSCVPTALGTGAASLCTVTLSKTAPSGGAVVSLSSTNGLLTVTGSVTVATGSTTATFNATAGAISADQTAAVTAAYNGSSQNTTLSLALPRLVSSLACAPATLGAAAVSNCSITLSKPAPAGGLAVLLSSSNAALTVPASVTVAAAATTATFSATAGNITSNSTAVVTANYNGSSQTAALSLEASATTGPNATPSNVLDAASYTANISPGGVFVVKGSNLSPNNGFVQAAYPLAATLNNVSITLTPVDGTVTVSAYMVYTFNDGNSSQLAAILPSTVAPGIYSVTVTNGGVTVGPFQTTVVARKFGLITAESTGTGMALAQNAVSQTQYDVNRYTTGSLAGSTYSPAHPGEAIIAWGTGLGAITGPDNVAPGVVDFSDQVTVQAIVGSKTITPFYSGRAPALAGADQVNFFLPPDVDTGCAVPFQISVDGQLSNPTTIAIAPPGASACISPQFSPDTLSRLDQGGSLTVGTFGISSTAASTLESANGFFARYSGDQLGTVVQFLNPTDACEIFVRRGVQTQLLFGAAGANLDAGPITLTGPNLNGQFTRDPTTNLYSLMTPGLTLVPGVYQLQGAGGADVGPFTASRTVGQPLTLTNGIPATIDRTNDLTLSWTGGNPTDLVVIAGISGTAIGNTSGDPTYDARVLVCTTTAGQGSFTIPARMLSQLPATTAVSGAGLGYMQVSSSTHPALGDGLFTAPLTVGGAIDSGAFLGMIGVSSTTIYQ